MFQNLFLVKMYIKAHFLTPFEIFNQFVSLKIRTSNIFLLYPRKNRIIEFISEFFVGWKNADKIFRADVNGRSFQGLKTGQL